MGQFVKENAHLRTDLNAYSEGWERIFASKEKRCDCHQFEERICDLCAIPIDPEWKEE